MFQTNNTDSVIRSTLYTNMLKQPFWEKLTATPFVYMLPNFTDGDTINIPSLGQAEIYDYAEGDSVKYGNIDTGNFQFSINQYKQGGFSITNKMKQDSWLAPQLISNAGMQLQRAMEVAVEKAILNAIPAGQTAANTNAINGAPHRWIGSGTNETIAIVDFAKARFALDKANVPSDGRIAIVDPSLEYVISTLAPIVGLTTYNPVWGDFIETGASRDMRFLRNIMGFDVYVSNHLTKGLAETINGGAGSRTTTTAVANLFMSASGGEANPVVGLIRQPPTVESEYVMSEQRENYILTMRYGFSLYRPETACVVLTDTDQVTF